MRALKHRLIGFARHVPSCSKPCSEIHLSREQLGGRERELGRTLYFAPRDAPTATTFSTKSSRKRVDQQSSAEPCTLISTRQASNAARVIPTSTSGGLEKDNTGLSGRAKMTHRATMRLTIGVCVCALSVFGGIVTMTTARADKSYNRMLWTALRGEAAYLPGC